MHDIRYALRSLLKTPGFLIAALATLAIAIGASTAVFSIANAVLLHPLGYVQPDRLVRLVGRSDEPARRDAISYPDYRDAVTQSGVFALAAAYDEWNPAASGVGEAEVLVGGAVDSAFFDVLGVRPARGRLFMPLEDVPGSDTSVVISHALWQRKFGGRTDIVGSAIALDGRSLTIVGVLPASFEHPYLSDPDTRSIDIWTTIAPDLTTDSAPRNGRSYTAVARLRDGVTLETAAARLDAVSRRLGTLYPDSNTGRSVVAVPLHGRITGDVRRPLWLLFGAVLLLLLIACVNVANLVLARVTRRTNEVAVRVAMGATPRHLVQRILTETLLLGIAGGVAGALLAHLFVRVFLRVAGPTIPRAGNVAVDTTVLLFVLALALLTALCVGLVPAVQLWRGRLSMKPGSRGTTATVATLRTQSSLVILQVAFSVVLLSGAALVARSLWNLMRVDLGLDGRGVVTFDVRAPRSSYPELAQIAGFHADLESRFSRLPGVTAAGATTILPLNGDFNCNGITIDGRPAPPPGVTQCPEARGVTLGYFRTIGIRLVAGRFFGTSDTADAPPVAVADEAFVRRFIAPDVSSALGRRFTMREISYEIVGVVRSARIMTPGEAPPPALYFHVPQEQTRRTMSFVVRSDVGVESLGPAVRQTVASLAPDAPVANLKTMREVVGSSVAPHRFRAILLTLFGGAALLLATVGVAGVLSCITAQREREIGVRMALGATARQIGRLVVGQGMRMVGAGLAAGAVTALFTNRLLQSMLYEVGVFDPLSLATIVAILIAAGVIAAAIPAARAAATQPMTVMRAE